MCLFPSSSVPSCSLHVLAVIQGTSRQPQLGHRDVPRVKDWSRGPYVGSRLVKDSCLSEDLQCGYVKTLFIPVATFFFGELMILQCFIVE